MDITTHIPHERPARRLSLARILTGFFKKRFKECRIARDQKRLESFPDYLLRDIAVSRSDIARTVRGGRGEP